MYQKSNSIIVQITRAKVHFTRWEKGGLEFLVSPLFCLSMVPTISLFLFSTGHTLSFASYVAPPWNELRIGKLGQYRLCMRHDPVLKQLLQRESWGAPCWFTDSLGFLWHLSILQSRSTTSPVQQRRTVNLPIRILRSMISADCHQCFREDFLRFFNP